MLYNHNATNSDKTAGWSAYYAKAGLGPPRPTLLHALDRLAAEGVARGYAVDLGCGVGRDALVDSGTKGNGLSEADPHVPAKLAE